MTNLAFDVINALDERTTNILESCTACGACVEVCPTPAIAGQADLKPGVVAAGILDILRDGKGVLGAEAWARACCGTGHCLSACEYGINPRFMLAMARRTLSRRNDLFDRKDAGKTAFQAMSRGVKVISRLQMSPDVMERLSPSSHPARRLAPDVVFYTGCNMLKTPHIGLICLDILDRLKVRYEVYGGPANCCGILQLRPGDDVAAGRQAGKTMQRFAETGATEVLSWCPTCNIQFGETLMPGKQPAIDIDMFPNFLASRLNDLRPLMKTSVAKKVALHEYPGSPGVTQSVYRLLGAIPGLEVFELPIEGVGYQITSLAAVPEFQKSHIAQTLRAAHEAGVTTLASVYHADHRELVSHEDKWSFEVVNYMELIADSMDLDRPDLFKRLKLMQDADAIIADSYEQIAAHGLDAEEVRDAVVKYLLGDQILPVDPALHPKP